MNRLGPMLLALMMEKEGQKPKNMDGLEELEEAGKGFFPIAFSKKHRPT